MNSGNLLVMNQTMEVQLLKWRIAAELRRPSEYNIKAAN
jgi:hypothetical protein